MQQIGPHAYTLEVELSFLPPRSSPNVYLIADGGEAILIDTGHAADESYVARSIMLAARPDLQVKYILLTHAHYDHSGAAYRMRSDLNAPIAMHRKEVPLLVRPDPAPTNENATEAQRRAHALGKLWQAEAAKVTPDILVEDGDELRVGSLTLRCVHTPGHTPGHISALLVEDRLLFAGDNVLSSGNALVGPPHGNVADYVRSLAKMQRLDAEHMAPGHGPITSVNPHARLQELIDHRARREQQIVALIGSGTRELHGLVRAVYPDLGEHLHVMGAGQLVAHLEKLENEGRVQLHRDAGTIRMTLL